MNHTITIFDGVHLRIDKPRAIREHPDCFFTKLCITAKDGSYSETVIHHNGPLVIEREGEESNEQ